MCLCTNPNILANALLVPSDMALSPPVTGANARSPLSKCYPILYVRFVRMLLTLTDSTKGGEGQTDQSRVIAFRLAWWQCGLTR